MTNGIRIYIGDGDLDILHRDLRAGTRSEGWIGRDENDRPVEVAIIDVNQEDEPRSKRVRDLGHLQGRLHGLTDATLIACLASTDAGSIDEWLAALHTDEHANAKEA